MAEIAVSDISKAYGIKEIFSKVTFNINEGDKIGIVGANGAGKTTLFNIISGRENPDSGNVFVKNDLKIAYMEQNVSVRTDKTVFDYMLEEFDYIFEMEEKLKELEGLLASTKDVKEIEALTLEYNDLLDHHSGEGGLYYESKIEGVLKGLNFPKERFQDPVSSLSGGELSRISLARLILSDADVLLLDEPTNHLDMSAISFLEQYLRDYRRVLVVISHDRFFLDRVVNRIFLMENNKLFVYNSDYTNFMKNRTKDREIAQREYENQQKEIQRQEAIIDKFLRAGKSLRKRGIAQARSRQKLLDKMKKMDKPDYFDEKMSLRFTPARESGEDVLKVSNLSLAFSDHYLYKDISFNIYKGQKIGLIGANGTGKTSLFKIILNKLRPSSGTVDLGVGVFPEYFDQQQSNLDPDKAVIDEIWDEYPDMTHYELRSYLAKFMFIGDDIFKLIDELSGGERARVTLLKLMLSKANFLLMDEPTNHLDIDSKEVLEEALRDYDATALIISHDRYFLNKVVDKIIVIDNQSIEEFEGNYDYYLQKLEERKPDYIEKEKVNKTQRTKNQKRTKEKEKLIRQTKAKMRSLEGVIDDCDNEIAQINDQFALPEVYEDHEKSLELQVRIKTLTKKKEEVFLEWADLMEAFDEME